MPFYVPVTLVTVETLFTLALMANEGRWQWYAKLESLPAFTYPPLNHMQMSKNNCVFFARIIMMNTSTGSSWLAEIQDFI